MHPDKFSQAAVDEQKMAEEAFRKVGRGQAQQMCTGYSAGPPLLFNGVPDDP
jgi:hypothetical protein